MAVGSWVKRIARSSPFYPNSQSGMVVPAIVIIMIILTISALALADFAINYHSRLNRNYFATNALLTAEAGAELSLNELNKNSSFGGYTSEQEFFSNNTQGRATYQTTVAAGSQTKQKIITATGRIYRRPGDTQPLLIRKVRLTVVGTTTRDLSVQTGPGGLITRNTATVANGDIYVNGTLTMFNNSRIGSPTSNTNVRVAHVSCPSGGGSSYPSQCSSGNPITLNNSALIYARVCATNQTNGDSMSNPGLISGCVAPPIPMPAHDRTAQIAAISNTMTGTQASCNGGTQVYPAHTLITGNVTLSNDCSVTVLGDVWITGSFTLQNSSTLKAGASLTERPTIMIDGLNLRFLQSTKVLANANDIGFQFITYRSTAACSPNCLDVTGNDLYNSRSLETIEISNTTLAPGSIVYARWSKATLNNSGSIGAIAGQTVELRNSGNITFGVLLSSGESVWSIKNYQQIAD